MQSMHLPVIDPSAVFWEKWNCTIVCFSPEILSTDNFLTIWQVSICIRNLTSALLPDLSTPFHAGLL
jgi:hypothetical protein